MLVRLDLSLSDRWTTLMAGFDVLHGPVTSAILSEAGHAASAATAKPGSAGEVDQPTIEARTVIITKFIAQAVIRDWRGVVDDATGQPLPVTPDTIEAVMDIWPIFRAFNERVIDARIRIDREKKGSPTSQLGTSGSEPVTAPTATGRARTAQAGSTGRKPSKGRRSGT